MKNEAHARIKINKLLEESGWRFFVSKEGKANICLENNVKITEEKIRLEGMKIDRMFFQKFEETAREDDFVKEKAKDEKWDEIAQYVSDKILNKPDDFSEISSIKYFFKAYISNADVRYIIDQKKTRLIDLNTNPSFNLNDYKEVPDRWRKVIPESVKDYVPLNQFMH